MKNWQFCLLMSAIYLSPVSSGWLNLGIAALFMVLAVAALIKEPKP